MDFALVSKIHNIETIALGNGVRDRKRLRKLYGGIKWRKLKGVAHVMLPNGRIRLAEFTGMNLTE
jgi:hypothetical protein